MIQDVSKSTRATGAADRSSSLGALVSAQQRPDGGRAWLQIVNSVGGYAGLWCAMFFTLSVGWWLTIPLAMLAGALLVRVFIIFHDCGHGSFFASRRANTFWGVVTGVLTFTPYEQWRGQHAVHHGTNGNLDRRGVGDIWTMTVGEYRRAGRWKRLGYRIVRNPVVLLAIAPLVMFLITNRIPDRRATARQRRSVWLTTASLVLQVAAMAALFGPIAYLVIQLTVLVVAGSIGVWLFYSQHQFEHAYWQRGDAWSYEDAALKGSAYLKLPAVLQWFTGNVGFHHIHHLDSRIPNYNLQACHESDPLFERVAVTTLFQSLTAFGLKLWDEASDRLVCFRVGRTRHHPCA